MSPLPPILHTLLLTPLVNILTLLFTTLLAIAAPVLHLAHYALYAFVLWPLGLVGKFETLYIFLGVATIIGLLAGTTLHFTLGFLVSVLNLDSPSPSPPPPPPPSYSSATYPPIAENETKPKAVPSRGRKGRRGNDEMIGREEEDGDKEVEGLKREMTAWENGDGGVEGWVGKGKGKKGEEEARERARVEGAYRRAERRGKGRVAGFGNGDEGGGWDRGRGGRKGVMTSTILEEESSSEGGF